jgi:putative transposase
MSSDNSLSHTSSNCKYHIVFIPKYRRKVNYGKLRRDIGAILRRLCEMKDVEIIEAHAMPDHIHMLVRNPPKMSVSYFMGYLKGKSLMIHDRHANLKYNHGNRTFSAKGYYVSTVGLTQKTVAKYIREQEAEDRLRDHMTRENTSIHLKISNRSERLTVNSVSPLGGCQ